MFLAGGTSQPYILNLAEYRSGEPSVESSVQQGTRYHNVRSLCPCAESLQAPPLEVQPHPPFPWLAETSQQKLKIEAVRRRNLLEQPRTTRFKPLMTMKEH